jgi:hypothetical protein
MKQLLKAPKKVTETVAIGMQALCAMRLLQEDVMGKIEPLVAELEAIKWWDAAYWRSKRPEIYETLALAARRKRRSEILIQLLDIVSDRNHKYD